MTTSPATKTTVASPPDGAPDLRTRLEPYMGIIAPVAIIAGWMLLTRTHFGRYTIAIGSEPQAAELTGIAIDRYKIYAYVLMGAMAGLAGVMLLAKLNAVQATSAPYFNLHVIAAVVVGGTFLFGGCASLLGSLAGVLFAGLDDQRAGHATDRIFLAVCRFRRRHRDVGRALHLASEKRPRRCAGHHGRACSSRDPTFAQADRHDRRRSGALSATAFLEARSGRAAMPGLFAVVYASNGDVGAASCSAGLSFSGLLDLPAGRWKDIATGTLIGNFRPRSMGTPVCSAQ